MVKSCSAAGVGAASAVVAESAKAMAEENFIFETSLSYRCFLQRRGPYAALCTDLGRIKHWMPRVVDNSIVSNSVIVIRCS